MKKGSVVVAILAVASACDPDRPERGCIQVDGRGHYRDVADAVELAEEGATLELCQDAVLESVVVDKAVTIQGLGQLESLWFPPEGEVGVRVVDGGDLTLIGIGIASTVDAFHVEAGGALTLRDVLISQPEGWGVVATDGAVTLDGAVVEAASLGAVHATGELATVSVSGSRLDGNTAWGVLGEAGAVIDVTDTILRATFVSDENASQFDGFAVGLKSGAQATLTGVTADGNVLGVLYGEGGSTAVIDDMTATNNYFGVWGETLDLTVRNSSFSDSSQYDILAVAGSAVTLEGVEITADPRDTQTNPLQDESNTLTGHYGLVMQTGASLTIRDSNISGHNGGALFVVGAVSLDVPVTIERTTLNDNATQGALFQWADVTMTDVDVTGTRNNDPACLTEDGFINCNWAVAAFAASVDWTRGTLSDNGFLGLLSSEDSASLTDVTMANNGSASVWGELAAIKVKGGSIAGYGEYGVYAYDTVLDLEDVAFVDRDFDWVLEQEGGLEYRFKDSAIDVYALLSTVSVDGASFTNGDTGLYLSSSETTLTDTSFSGYVEAALTVAGGSLDGTGVEMTAVGPRSLYCSGSGSVNLSSSRFADSRHTTGRTETYIDGVLQEPVSTYTLVGPVLQASTCSIDLDGVTIDGADDRAIDVSNGDIELSDVLVRDTARKGNAATAASVQLKYTSRSPVLFASGLTITGVNNGGALLVQGRPADTSALVSLQDTRIGVADGDASGVAGDGVSLVTLGCADAACAVDVEGLEIAGTGGHGLTMQGTFAAITGPGGAVESGAITDAGGDGVTVRPYAALGAAGPEDDVRRDGHLALADLAVTGVAGDGVRVVGSGYALDGVTVTDAAGAGLSFAPWLATGPIPEEDVRVEPIGTIDTVSVSGAGASGVSLVGGEHTVTALEVSSAGGWGMECAETPEDDVPAFPSCAVGTVTGTLGAFSPVCEAACAP